jgi:iron-sulfur cluster repair protein YtfE (RIC family)
MTRASKTDDPLKRFVEKDGADEALSPMDPPDAFKPPNIEETAKEDMHPYLQELMDEHEQFTTKISAFETAITAIPEEGVTQDIHREIVTFFEFLDSQLRTHSQKEDLELFPLLRKRMLETGEHSKGITQGADSITPVDVMDDDHIEMMQMAAVVFNFFALGSRLPDMKSQVIVFDAAVEQSKILIEHLRLHFFREDHVVFPMAQKLIDNTSLTEIATRGEQSRVNSGHTQ